ncbi:pisatin demethylase [Plenodomus tracheiphilus IPT5]|uniref:Pisatin demethylase n=1 Tax=Plenodomus tracheiphilus IPT5 TaxID=1408161 RepID=A0A6A7AZ74_9PLEO|nr:pisatin demethylase [Plenodomus tracheiphilus IPT5]
MLQISGLDTSYLQLLCFGLVLARLLYNKYGNGLARVRGPILAAYTDLWRLFVVWRRRPEQTHIRLHERYGPVVRLGPKCISISDPEAIKVIYAIKAGFVKSDFYPVQQPVTKDGQPLQGMFNTTNEIYHAKLRRAVSNAFAMSTLVQFEPLVDSTTRAFLKQLSERYADRPGQDGVCDFGAWLQYYAFDVIGEMTFSRRLGFVDRGIDVAGIIHDLERMLGYAAVVGQIPVLDRLLLKNPVRFLLGKLGLINPTTPVVNFARTRMASRLDGHTETNLAGKDGPQTRRDFLSRFLEASQKDPDFLTSERVLSLTTANMFAGSDTTAISLRAIFHFLLQTPKALQRLLDELDLNNGKLFDEEGFVKWSDVHELPYLSAVIKESLRCHPAVGLPLERVVPPSGAEICGYHFPPGTIVGCSAWTVHRDETVFGHDAASFRPERWLEATEEGKSKMSNVFFAFGAGSRTCAGRHISYLEMYKLVPAVFRKFELTLVRPEEDLKLRNAWFVKQSNFHIRLKTRNHSAR